MDTKKTLYRLPKQGQIAGVCAGIADYFDVDVSLMRLIWVIMAFVTGGGIVIVYFILAIVVPTPDSDYSNNRSNSSGNNKNFSQKAHDLGDELQKNKNASQFRNILGLGLLLLGLWLLLVQFFPQWISFRWDFVWPVILMLVGFLIIVKRR